MRKRKYLIGATLGVPGALVVSGTAFAGVPTGQTLSATVAPSKLQAKTFSGASLHNIIATTYSDFNGSPAAKETKFTLDKQHQVRQRQPARVSEGDPGCSDHHGRGSGRLSRSIVGVGTNEVNNKTGFFTSPNPVLLVSGGPTTLYVWTRIANSLTLVLNGQYAAGPNTLDVTGLPITLGTDLTLFDTTMIKGQDGQEHVLRDGSL